MDVLDILWTCGQFWKIGPKYLCHFTRKALLIFFSFVCCFWWWLVDWLGFLNYKTHVQPASVHILLLKTETSSFSQSKHPQIKIGAKPRGEINISKFMRGKKQQGGINHGWLELSSKCINSADLIVRISLHHYCELGDFKVDRLPSKDSLPIKLSLQKSI